MGYPTRLALRVGGIYLVLAALWILFTDRAVDALFADPDLRSTAQTAKGLLFIVGTTALITGLIHRDASRRHEVETRYRSMVDQSLMGIYVLRGERLLFANARLAEIFGYTVEELTSSVRVGDLTAPEDRERVASNIRRRLTGEEDDIRYTFTGVRKNGGHIRVEVHGRRILWEGEPAILGVLLDNTEKERLEARTRQRQRLETLGQLTAAVTHDFKNLLTSISTPVELTLQQLEPHHPARQDLEEARQNTKRAVVLTRQLLAFCRQRSYRPRSVDLAALVRKSEPMLRRLLREGVGFEMEVQDDLPAAWVDPDRVEQVLLNLVLNAIEAVDATGTIRVRARKAPSGEGLLLEVEDDGTGMEEHVRSQVFEPFFSTKKDGTGLGLATVHGIVSQAGGWVEVESTPGLGTLFTILLPESGKPPEPFETDDAQTATPAPSSESATILVVDDDDGVRRSTSRALERNGFRVLQADSGQGAVDRLQENDGGVDLVLTDVMLPDRGGVGLASDLSGAHPELTVLFMSGRSAEEVLGSGGARPYRFLEKPFSVDTLIREVRRGLS